MKEDAENFGPTVVPDEIPLAEFDFSGVDDAQLKSCAFYEYARESTLIAEVRDAIRRILTNRGTAQDRSPPTVCMPFVLVNFPETPWRGLPKDQQESLMRHLNAEWLTELRLWGLPKEELQSVRATPRSTYGFFELELERPERELVEEFRLWLRYVRDGTPYAVPLEPLEPAEPKKPRGRHTYRDWLNAISAMRLRYYCATFSEAQAKMKLACNKKTGMYYGDRRDFNRATKAALEHFRDLFGRLDPGFPIHWREAWAVGK